MTTDLHVSAKACVVRHNKILLVQYHDVNEVGYHYNLPGGRLRPNETLLEGCRRKTLEETGGLVTPLYLLFVYEYIGRNHQFLAGDKHSVSLIFRCDLEEGSEPSMARCTKPDSIQTDVCWVGIEDLRTIDLLPRVQDRLRRVLLGETKEPNPYWGDIL